MHSFLLLLNIVDGYILHLRTFYTNIEGGVESFQSTAAHEFSSKCGCAAGGQDICMGRSDKPPGKGWSMLTRSIFSLRIGWIDLFSKFVTRPVMLLPNISNISLTACSSFWFGCMKIAAASAYREVLYFVIVRGSDVSTPCWIVLMTKIGRDRSDRCVQAVWPVDASVAVWHDQPWVWPVKTES